MYAANRWLTHLPQSPLLPPRTCSLPLRNTEDSREFQELAGYPLALKLKARRNLNTSSPAIEHKSLQLEEAGMARAFVGCRSITLEKSSRARLCLKGKTSKIKEALLLGPSC